MRTSRPDIRQRKRRRWTWALLGVILALLVLLLAQASRSGRLGHDDFVEYWAAGRLNLTGGDPYSPAQLLPLQVSAGLPGGMPILMWNPPWTLAVAMPFALLPYGLARVLWLVAGLGTLLLCAHWLWAYFGGPPARRWVALLAVATFLAGLFALRMGQISPLLLLGLAGFLYFEQRERGWAAGACASLLAIKPHLLFLFWLALLLWALRRRAWSYLLGAAVALLLATAVAALVNPPVVGQYLQATAAYPPIGWKTPTLGGLLRYFGDGEPAWLQFLPAAVGAAWFLSYWRRHGASWRWPQQISLVVAVSLTTAAYGWDYDQVLMLAPILQVAALTVARPWDRTASLVAAGYLLINSLALALNILRVEAFWFFWMAPAYLLWYLAARQLLLAPSPEGRPVPS